MNLVGLDCWLEEGDLDTAEINSQNADNLLAFIFEERSDLEITEQIKSYSMKN